MVRSLAFPVSGDRIWCAAAPLWPQYIRNPLHHSHVYGLRLTVFRCVILLTRWFHFVDPETSGRPLEQIDDFFSNATSWNVFTASKQIREQGFTNHQWTRKYHGGIEQSNTNTSSMTRVGGDVDAERHGWVNKLRRRASDAGLV